MRKLAPHFDKIVFSVGNTFIKRPWLGIGSAVMIFMSCYWISQTHTPGLSATSIPAPSFLAKKLFKPPFSVKIITIQAGDTLAAIFSRVHIPYSELQAILALPKVKNSLASLRPGHKLTLSYNHQQIHKLTYSIDPDTLLVITKNKNAFERQIVYKKPTVKLAFAHTTIDTNLFNAAHKAHLNYALMLQFANIFAWKIDFSKQIKPGTHMSMLYQTYYRDGKKIRDGHIIAATLTIGHKTYQAFRFKNGLGDAAYYTPLGVGFMQPLMRRPIHHAHISSRFNLHRWHPIMQMYRPHYGIDYAAPRGTPILAAGEGHIVAIGKQGGYGNRIVIKHNAHYQTVYAHMAHFAKGMKKYRHVHRGEVIGYVGSTGMSTGPHLHYEIRIDRHAKNPLKAKLPHLHRLAKRQLQRFKMRTKALLARMQPTT